MVESGHCLEDNCAGNKLCYETSVRNGAIAS
jgi:hypothetical protein